MVEVALMVDAVRMFATLRLLLMNAGPVVSNAPAVVVAFPMPSPPVT